MEDDHSASKAITVLRNVSEQGMDLLACRGLPVLAGVPSSSRPALKEDYC